MPSEMAPMRAWVAEPLSLEADAALRRIRRLDDVQEVAVMPDVHLASDVCIGTVVATSHLIYPNAVGGDIGCGMAAIAFDGAADVINDRRAAARILAGFADRVPILKQRGRQTLPPNLSDRRLSHESLEKQKDRDAALQLGTLGRGNHFLELQADEDRRLWLMAHSGSRSIGQRIRDHHLRRCEKSASGLGYLDGRHLTGEQYLSDMRWALDYAEENRRRIVGAAAEVVQLVSGLRADPSTLVTCNHNHVERVADGNRSLWVHRKGAIPASDGEAGIIPGSMGGHSFHVCGRGDRSALWSSSHGAGRSMSRSEARRRISVSAFEQQVEGVWFDHRRTRRLIDEAPGAYKDIAKVMKAQRDLTRIVRRLSPVLSYKGG
jgi:tRNA-splicing ligase RtcB